MNAPKSDAYVLDRNEDEYKRLVAQAQLWAPATRIALNRAGLGAGMRTLDVGCGPGTVMQLMADVVGPTGRVTGLDAELATIPANTFISRHSDMVSTWKRKPA